MPNIDQDKLRDLIIESFNEVLFARYGVHYAASRKWTSPPLRFQSGYPLGGFFKLLETDLRQRIPSLKDFRIPKGYSTMASLQAQVMSQSVAYVYGLALVFLAKADDQKVL